MFSKNPAYKSVTSTQSVLIKKKKPSVLEFIKNWFK